MDNNFDLFMQTVDEPFKEFVTQLNEYLRENGCKCVIKTAKSGYVVSYVSQASNKSLANFVSRKTGMKLRIYAPHVAEYQDFLNTLPPKMIITTFNNSIKGYLHYHFVHSYIMLRYCVGV